MRLREADVSKQVNDFLNLRGWRVTRLPAGVVTHQSGRRMKIGETGRADWECTRPSASGRGHVDHFFREDKAPAGRRGAAQVAWSRRMEAEGYLVCTIPPGMDGLTWFREWYRELGF